jgi:DNA-binding XRE family transcriptional regulator
MRDDLVGRESRIRPERRFGDAQRVIITAHSGALPGMQLPIPRSAGAALMEVVVDTKGTVASGPGVWADRGKQLFDTRDNFDGMSSTCALTDDTKVMGQYLRGLREEAELSQRDLADRLGCHQPAIARLEAGRVRPNVETLRRIVEALGFRLELHAVSRDTAFAAGVPVRIRQD